MFVIYDNLAFGNVSELDILFGMDKAYTVLDEVFIAGHLQESSLKRVAKAMKEVEFIY
jgi:AP-1 complex subunit sigma 1/2